MKEILTEELKVISVSDDEASYLKKVSSDFIKSLRSKGLNAFIGGSLAKNTLVKKDIQDVDIFVQFDYSEDILKLEGVLKGMKLPGELKKVHGSRDYFHVIIDSRADALLDKNKIEQEVILEIIPVVKNKDPEIAENVTDMSLSHVKYVNGELKKNTGLAGEIMLAKAFCWANRCYGAEGYIRGFSGYSLEILVIYFGGFVKFLKGIRRLRIIDPCKYFKNKREIMREINSSKLQGPLVVVDPTYKYRNVSAGLGLSTFEKFLEVSGEFLKKPSLEFFKRREVDVDELRKLAKVKRARLLELELSTDRQEGDIAGTKMKKVFRFFERELERLRQVVLRAEFDYNSRGNRAKGYLVVIENKFIERKGPSVGLKDESLKFCEGKEGCFKRKGFWWFKENVSVEDILKFVKGFEGEMGARISLKY